MDITFRSASARDAQAVTPLVYASGPVTFDYVLAAPKREMSADKFLCSALKRPEGEFGHRLHWVGEVNGEIVAAGAGYDARTLSGSLLINVRQVVSAYGFPAALGVIRRGLAVERRLPPPTGDEWMISHLGVAPELRGHGIGAQLVEALLERGRARGRTVALLDVSLENPRAEALYERLGFKVTGEVSSSLRNAHGHVPGFRRMALRL